MSIRIVTLNVWNEQGDPKRTGLINTILKQLDPDLIALQEVIRSPKSDQLAKLVLGMGFDSTHQADAMATTPEGMERYGGSAIATRWPHKILEVLDPRLSDAKDVPWCSLAASVPMPNGQELLFIAVTGAWRFNAESARERQALAISDLDARHRRTLPTIIAGDFNASPDAASIRFMTGKQSINGHSTFYHDAWAIAGECPGHTWTIDNPNTKSEIEKIVRQPEHRRRVDYVFVGGWDAHPKAHAYVRSAKLAFNEPIDDIWPSDHFGVVVDIEFGVDN